MTSPGLAARSAAVLVRRYLDSGAVLVRADLVDLVRGDGWLVHVTAQMWRDVQLRGLSAGRSVRFRSHDMGRERALDTTDGVGAKPPPRERRAPAGWRPPGGELMPLEEEMVASAAAGELVDCGSGPFDLVEMQAWGEDRTVRAAVLRHLLIGKDWPADARGVRLRGIRISGPLDLQAATLHCPGAGRTGNRAGQPRRCRRRRA